MEFQVTAGPGRSVRVLAENKAAARWIARNQLGVRPNEPVAVRRVLAMGNIQLGGMSAEDQEQLLVEYEQLLVSRVPLEKAFRRLGSKIKTPLRGEPPSETMRRSGFHPVVCAIIAAGEAAGRPDEGAGRASDWLSERQRRVTQQIRPAHRQVGFALLLMAFMFVLPLMAGQMFSILPADLVTLKHNTMSTLLMNANEVLFTRLPVWLALLLVWSALGAVIVALIKAPDAIRLRIPMLGAMTRLQRQEHLTAWLSIFLPFYRASLSYGEFVEAGARACTRGPLMESFRLLKKDFDAGEVDSISTAARVRPEAVPEGLVEGIVMLGALDKEPGERYLASRIGVSSRKMRQLAQQASGQARMIRNLCLVAISAGVLLGIYVPLLESASL